MSDEMRMAIVLDYVADDQRPITATQAEQLVIEHAHILCGYNDRGFYDWTQVADYHNSAVKAWK